MIWTPRMEKIPAEKKQWMLQKAVLSCILTAAIVGFALFLVWRGFLGVHEEYHPRVDFEDKLREVCEKPKLHPPEYRGVHSFFNFIANPDAEYCYSLLEFGGEKIPIPTQSESECADEIRKTKYICFNEEYRMTQDPCLVYSFGRDADSQFERDMDMFSCEVHSFDLAKGGSHPEHVQRSEFWFEHTWDIADYPYDTKDNDNQEIKRRSLDYIATVLGHKGREVKFLKSDLEGREWILLKQAISHHDLLDINQIGVRLHIPVSVNGMSGVSRHEYFGKLFKVFQGLYCTGYKYVLGRPVTYYRRRIKVPEMNKTFYPAYEVNFVKVIDKM